MKRCLYVFLSLAFIAKVSVAAEQSEGSDGSSKSYWDIEGDLLYFANKGYSFHVGYNDESIGRIDVGTFAMEIPESLLGSDKFEGKMTSSYSIFWDNTTSRTEGMFYGVVAASFNYEFTHKESDKKEKVTNNGIGGRIGTRLRFDNFNVIPWFALGLAPGVENFEVGDDELKRSSLIVAPGLHVAVIF